MPGVGWESSSSRHEVWLRQFTSWPGNGKGKTRSLSLCWFHSPALPKQLPQLSRMESSCQIPFRASGTNQGSAFKISPNTRGKRIWQHGPVRAGEGSRCGQRTPLWSVSQGERRLLGRTELGCQAVKASLARGGEGDGGHQDTSTKL